MAIMKKKIVSKIESPVVNEEQDAPVELLKAAAAETVSVKIKRGGEYGSWGIELFHSKAVQEGKTAEETLDEIINTLSAKMDLYVENAFPEITVEPAETTGETSLPDTQEETAVPETESEELTEEDVLAMTKAELIILIAEKELDINPKEYKKQADLAKAIVEVLFGEEVAAEEGAGEEGDELTPDMIREMERPELEQLIADSEDLDINPKKFKKTSDLAEAIIEACFAEETDSVLSDGTASDSGEGEGEEMTPEMIREMERPELVDLIKNGELTIDPKKFKKTADLAEAIITELFVDEEASGGSDWEDTDFGD